MSRLIACRKEIAELPDLIFARFCEKEYGVNKGIYNTIDAWFFERGLDRIVERRQMILAFFMTLKLQENASKIKFGSRGLAARLNHFWLQQSKETSINGEGVEQK